MAELSDYLNLITSEHRNQPNFIAFVSIFLQWAVDFQNQNSALPALFDPDTAVGDQLDKVGAWVGASRSLKAAINGVISLDDDTYRILVKLVIAVNNWDGTTPGAYTVWNAIFSSEGIGLLLQDYCDLTMGVVFLFNNQPSELILAILTNGYFQLKPATVRIIGYAQPSVANVPIFGLGVENALISGLGVGALVETINV